jgi:hypothetical protein
MPGQEPLKLSSSDFYTPRVEGYLEEQAVLTRGVPETPPQSLIIKILYSSCFYLSVAGVVGGLGAWACTEPFYNEKAMAEPHSAVLSDMTFFAIITAGIGLLLGIVEGLVCRNPLRAVTSALAGVGIGFIGGCVMAFIAHWLYIIAVILAMAVSPPSGENDGPHGFGFLVLMMGRGLAWAVAALAAGLGQGIALRDKKIVANGLIGGALGGLVGGLLFDPLYMLFKSQDSAALSRAVAIATIGLSVGLFIGLVENWSKSAWLLMRAGPLAGKQFILFRNPTVIGSSPKADVYLFKDAAIEPQHALIHDRGGRFELEDVGTAKGTYINGNQVKRKILAAGDQIVIGQTVLEFALKDKE